MENVPNNTLMLTNHPCFNREARHRTGRVHLPLAEKCNIQCGFCNRKYDCVNESRPGVTSAVLGPQGALDYLGQVLEKIPNIAVTGIAGPGDPFAVPDATLETLRLVRARYPKMLLCVATNGLGLPPYVGALAGLGVSHVTVTVNAVNPVIGMKIYEWVQDRPHVRRGINGARFLFERQEESVRALKEAGITVKINTVVVPGVNDRHTEEVAAWAAKAGADVHNFIPVLPVSGTLFEGVVSPSPAEIAGIRLRAGKYLPQMSHCGRCRADAAGLLGADNAAIIDDLLRKAGGGTAESRGGCPSWACPLQQGLPPQAGAGPSGGDPPSGKPHIAVTTGDGFSINRHLGRADYFYVFCNGGDKPELVEIREAPPASHTDRWAVLGETLRDCFAVLTAASGFSPKRALAEAGIIVYDCEGEIADSAMPLFAGIPLPGGFGRETSAPEPQFNCSRAVFCTTSCAANGAASCENGIGD
ncbi:MAG: radical SAM protein [Spirochaetaceae bacterium]|jgi:nitrogen fixation protein NifB|nr:radical SAM protein [Spirochaetaceae bacterium]